MERYMGWSGTPVSWYKFLMYVTMPLSLLLQLFQLPELLESVGVLSQFGLAWLGLLLLGLVVVSLGTIAVAEIGMLRKKWFGPCCVLAVYGWGIVGGLLLTVMGVVNDDGSSVSSGVIEVGRSGIFLAICAVYFLKRRALFAPAPFWLEERNRAFEAMCEERAREEKIAAEGYHSVYPSGGGEEQDGPG